MIKIYMLLLIITIIACGPMTTQGPPGLTGPQGPPGTSNGCSVTNVGVSSVAPNGGAMISCSDGTSSLVLNGSNGSAGTLVTAVQFCPGTPSYPSTFPEIGFCISGNIYAVYSANGGFLSEITPGAYQSDGINDSCVFNVGSNCSISY